VLKSRLNNHHGRSGGVVKLLRNENLRSTWEGIAAKHRATSL
jgi:hypothetical protein